MPEGFSVEHLPDVVTSFRNTDPSRISSDLKKHADDHTKTLFGIEEEDMRWKLWARKWFSIVAFVFLIAQNYLVFALVYQAFYSDKLVQLQVILSILVTGTLAETVGAIKIMVEWVFRDIKYRIPKVE